MPATDALRIAPFLYLLTDPAKADPVIEPPLTPAERKIVNSYGGWTQFMHSFGLKPWELDDNDSGKRILESFVKNNSNRENVK